jgi:glucose-6-phosphate isomerase
MESNGKAITSDGSTAKYTTGEFDIPQIWNRGIKM